MEGSGDPGKWPERDLEAVRECPVCKSMQRSILYTDLTDRVFFCAPGMWQLYQCQSCQAAYLDPRPTAASIHLAYTRYYTHQATQSDRQPAQLGVKTKIKRLLHNGYLNARYGYHLRPALPLAHFLMPKLIMLQNYADREVRCLPLPPDGRLLDVGCGNGIFLAQMREYGWNVAGLDFDPNAVSTTRSLGIDATCGTLETSTYPPNSFDAVCLNHVIEHLYDPVDTLRICHHILKPGGSMYVATPNIKSAGHDRHQQSWLGLESPRHLVLFSPTALIKAFELAGFREMQLSAIPDSVKFFLQSTAVSRGCDPYSYNEIDPETFKKLVREDKQAVCDPKLSNNIAVIGRK